MDWRKALEQDRSAFVAGLRSVCIVGAGASGIAVAQLAARHGIKAILTDAKLLDAQSKAALAACGCVIQEGGHTRECVNAADCVVISPGVCTESFFQKYVDLGRPFVGEIEFAYWFCKSRDIVGITGTNGKSTTTSMCGGLLEATGRKVFVGGNLGTPLSSFVDDVGAEDIVVLELSSFQLETTILFAPHVSVLLNLQPDHLDRYATLGDYYAAKERIFLGQSVDDTAVIASALQSRFSELVPHTVWVSGKRNDAFAREVGRVYGLDDATMDAFFATFVPLTHRIEPCGVVDGVTYLNDSKATNTDATIFALDCVDGPIILMAGGKDKGIEYRDVIPYLKNVRKVLCFGAAGPVIAKALSGSCDLELLQGFKDAFARARSVATAGDTVLLSPMCSSFDEFKNYKERGDVFRESVRQLRG
jgi:UDP-N-acetylmuramoylalanine--D-glutamate ligase